MANTTTLQVGAYNSITDTFTLTLDLNDGVTNKLMTLKLSSPPKELVKSWNIRTRGERVLRKQYKNRIFEVTLQIKGANSQTVINAVHSLIQAIEQPEITPGYCLKVQLAQGSNVTYWDVAAVDYEIPYDWQKQTAGLVIPITLQFEVAPAGRGARQTLSNLLINPSFEAPSGPAVNVFNDIFTNFNAYVPQQYATAVNGDTPQRWYRLQEQAGTLVLDYGSAAQNGTYNGTVTLAQAGICGGATFSATFDGSTGYISAPTTGLPTVNHAVTLECWINFAANPAAGKNIISLGSLTTNEGLTLSLGTSGKVSVAFQGGTGVVSTSALSTGAWHHVAATWDGTTLTLYVDGASTGTPVTPGAANLTYGNLYIAANYGLNVFLAATLDEVAIYTTALSAARVLAHYNAGAPTVLASGTSGLPEAIDALNGAAGTGGNLAVARYFRLDEASGTTAFDASGNAQNGTYQASPTLGASSLLVGDTDASVSFASASSQYVNCPVTGLPTGNANISLWCRFNYPSHPGANVYLMTYGGGAGGAHNYIGVYLDSSGRLNADTGGTTVQSTAVSTSANHDALVTWDGTTLRLYLDGSSVGTPQTPGNQTLPTSSNFFRLAASANTAANLFYNGTLDEAVVFSGCLTSTQATTLHTAATTTPGVASNTMLLPAAARSLFGSPAWGPINLWTVRWKFASGVNPIFYLHFTDINNWLGASITSTQMQVIQNVAGTQNVLATTSSLGLVNGVWYWLQMTLFPAINNIVDQYAQASLFADSGGTLGTQIQSTAGPVLLAATNLATTGNAGIQANSAALTIGGAYAGVHTVGLFGPGNWSFSSSGTGTGMGAWEQTPANTYPAGPVTSFSAGRIDAAAGGTLSEQWLSANVSNIAATACPVAAPTDIIGVSAWTRNSNLSAANGSSSVYLNEYNAAGTFLRQTLVGMISGAGIGVTSSWAQISGTVTTGANCAYVALALLATDNSGTSPSATVWFDNCQVWDVSATGATSMPYCELRFSQTPAMLVVSGLLGDVSAPAFLEMGTFISSLAANNQVTLLAGRRALVDPGCQLVLNGTDQTKPVLDPTSYGGYYCTSGTGKSAYTPTPIINMVIGHIQGVFHLYTRGFTSQATVANVTEQLVLGSWNGPSLTPFTTQNTWTPLDCGQVILPLSPLVSEGDPTVISLGGGPQWADSTGGGSEMREGWLLFLPFDAEVVSLTFNNPSTSSTVTNSWLYCYVDGAVPPQGTPALGFSTSSSGLPLPVNSANVPGTLSSFARNVQSSGDAYLRVDPTIDTTTNQLNQGVNQIGTVVYDTSGNIYPIHCYVLYEPRYLWPQ